MSSRPREPEGDDLADDPLVEPDWVERLRLAREQHTREWGKRFGAPRSSPDAADPPSEPGAFDPDVFEMPERQAAAKDAFFDQDAPAAGPVGARVPKPGELASDDAFYDQDEERWT